MNRTVSVGKIQNSEPVFPVNLKNIVVDSNGMEHEPHLLHTFQTNMCQFSNSGVPAHEDYLFIMSIMK